MKKTQVLERGQWPSKDEPQETNDVTGTVKEIAYADWK